MALTMQSPGSFGPGTQLPPLAGSAPRSPPDGATRNLTSREKRTFKEKLLTMVQDAELQEQQALREAQTQDKKSLSIGMLMEGRPQAFVDFFYLTHTNGGAASTSGVQRYEEEELPQESLLLLKAQLAKADAASREGHTEEVFGSYKALAKYFAQLGRLRKAEFFFKQALHTARDAGWITGELDANLALGVVYEELQDIQSAIACYERRLELASENMLSADMETAYQNLTNVYLGQAENQEVDNDTPGALDSYTKCLNAAERAGNSQVRAKAHYRMGMLHYQQQRWHDAMYHLRKFTEEGAAALGDKVAEGVAFTTLAQCLREVGDADGAVASLEQYLETMQRGQEQSGPAIACCSLGNLYYDQGDYARAVTYFEKFFEIARTLSDRRILDTARFNLGVARGAMRMSKYMDLVNTDLPRLILWKNSRAEF
mmetsp:Transcript_23375/g.51305  ORF Transcript_23375/g.51305 Transcript_23375/m.51305 type:complete len:430 (+) Transcript_23375:222-1511(+)